MTEELFTHDDRLAADLRALAGIYREIAATLQTDIEAIAAEGLSPGAEAAIRNLRRTAVQVLRAARDAEKYADLWDERGLGDRGGGGSLRWR